MIGTPGSAIVGLVAIVGALGGAPDAMAQVYISGNFGGAVWSDADMALSASNGGGSGTAIGTAEHKVGLAGAGAVGYAAGNGRFEFEFSYRQADVDRLSGSGDVTVGGVTETFSGRTSDTDVAVLALMVNGWYDFDTGTAWRPFVGVGVGVARVELTIGTADTGFASAFEDTDTVFAYQAGLGIGYEITRHITAAVSYRYLETSNPVFKTTISSANVSAKTEVKIHNVFAGLMIKF